MLKPCSQGLQCWKWLWSWFPCLILLARMTHRHTLLPFTWIHALQAQEMQKFLSVPFGLLSPFLQFSSQLPETIRKGNIIFYELGKEKMRKPCFWGFGNWVEQGLPLRELKWGNIKWNVKDIQPKWEENKHWFCICQSLAWINERPV